MLVRVPATLSAGCPGNQAVVRDLPRRYVGAANNSGVIPGVLAHLAVVSYRSTQVKSHFSRSSHGFDSRRSTRRLQIKRCGRHGRSSHQHSPPTCDAWRLRVREREDGTVSSGKTIANKHGFLTSTPTRRCPARFGTHTAAFTIGEIAGSKESESVGFSRRSRPGRVRVRCRGC